MNRRFKLLPALAVASALIFAACANPRDIADLKATMDEVQSQQKDILAKLDSLAKGQKQLVTQRGAAARRPAEDPNKVYKLTVGDSYMRGPENAPVTIVEFSDFQCPFCAQASKLVEQIIEAYPKEVRFVYKNFPLPFHREAMPAAKAALAAGRQGKFWEMHDKLFANQRSLGTDFYVKAAEELGLDVERFKKDMEDPAIAEQINKEMKEAREASVRGTPTFYINGKKPQGRSFQLYKSIIDGILKGEKAA